MNFLLDTNIFGIDVDRDPYNADQTTLIQLYQPNLFLPPGGFNFTVPETVQALQLYNTYITEVRKNLSNWCSIDIPYVEVYKGDVLLNYDKLFPNLFFFCQNNRLLWN